MTSEISWHRGPGRKMVLMNGLNQCDEESWEIIIECGRNVDRNIVLNTDKNPQLGLEPGLLMRYVTTL